jgi:predicted DCC family thiol-disulfide oxidoreductase YuxK
MNQSDTPPTETCVLYNGACPICSAEISHYAAYADTRALPLRFEDLGKTDLASWGLSADQAARRLHVRKDGTLLSGLPAFRVLWAEMPRYRWLARLTGWPILRPLATASYDHVLAPLLYHWHRIRFAGAEKTGKPGPST